MPRTSTPVSSTNTSTQRLNDDLRAALMSTSAQVMITGIRVMAASTFERNRMRQISQYEEYLHAPISRNEVRNGARNAPKKTKIMKSRNLSKRSRSLTK